MWRRCRNVLSRWRRPSASHKTDLSAPKRDGFWEYQVVQMVPQAPADAADASRKLGGSLSPEALRSQFPEHYGGVNGRKQINDFLNVLGDEGWELVQFQQIGELPLMVFKRPKHQVQDPSLTQTEAAEPANQVG